MSNATISTQSTIRGLRIDMYGTLCLMRNLDKSRELNLAIMLLQTARMWTGQMLKNLGTDNPCPDSRDTTNNKIAPTADVAMDDLLYPDNCDSHVKRVKHLRTAIDFHLAGLDKGYPSENTPFNECLQQSMARATESQMWLGMELGRIRDENETLNQGTLASDQ